MSPPRPRWSRRCGRRSFGRPRLRSTSSRPRCPRPIVSISLRAWPPDFPDDIAVQRRSPYEARADAIMYRQVLVELAHARDWQVHFYDAKDVIGPPTASSASGPTRCWTVREQVGSAVDEGPSHRARRDDRGRPLTAPNHSDVISGLERPVADSRRMRWTPADQALVRTILEHAADYPWRMQEIGLLGLRLDDRRRVPTPRVGPERALGDPPVHDHPSTSRPRSSSGEMTNTRTRRIRPASSTAACATRPSNEDDRRRDTVRLSGVATTFTAGRQYHQLGA